MFGSAVLDVAIGLVLVYLLLSLCATAVREAIEGVVKLRAVYLERGVRELLADREGSGLARELYEHPLVAALYAGEYAHEAERRRGGNLPAYIPRRNFAVALLDLAHRGPVGAPAAYAAGGALTIESLRAGAQRFASPAVRRALLTAIDESHGDVRRVRANVEAWFDSAMDRVSGWYRRRTQLWLFVIGGVMAVALDVNTITIARHLARNRAAREALVARASLVARDSTYRGPAAGDTARSVAAATADARRVYDELAVLDLPIGWGRASVEPQTTGRLDTALTTVFGLLLTALAVTLGAPFWFDALNKVMIVRSTVKPHEKSPEEPSLDRPPARPRAAPNVAEPAEPPPSAVRAEQAVLPRAEPRRAAEQLVEVEPAAAFEPQRWNAAGGGDDEEGIL